MQANWIFRSEATLKSSETPFRAQRDGACQRSSNNVGYTVVLPPQPSGQLPRWGAKNVLPLNLIAFPRGEGCDTRIPSSKKAAHHPCEPIRSPSTVIPSEAEGSLLHCRHMHTCALTQTTPWCFLFRLFLAHDLPSLQEGSLYFGPHDTQERRIVSYRFSYRCVELYLFEALYPAPSARAVWPHRKTP